MSIFNPHVYGTSLFARLVVTFGLVSLGGASPQVTAQAPAPPPAAAQSATTPAPTIEVASIKRNREVEEQRAAVNPNFPQVPGRAQTLRGGLVSGRGMSVEELIRDAYGYRNRAHGDIGLVLDTPKEGEPAPLPPCLASVGYAMIAMDNTIMTDWVKILALRPQINRTVIDRTGLTGNYDIRLTNPAAGDPNAANLLPPIKPLLEDQLGLTLRDAEGAVEILVIENVEHPSAN